MSLRPLLSFAFLLPFACATPPGARFDSPEAAVHALADSAGDPARTERLIGWDAEEPLCSGAEGDDCEDLQAIRSLIGERVEFADVAPDRKVALLGNEQWELPLPLVREGDGWRFDVDSAKEEIRCRRVGANELRAIATLHELVDAQHEYFATTRDSNARAYALKWSSDGDRKDGLYWPTADGEPESPLGPLFCRSAADHASAADPSCSAPCHGYCYRILSAQGPHASGGARSYLDASGRLGGGFAFVAWPVDYGETGVMTFQVDALGMVFQKDLGPASAHDAPKLAAYDPDDSWELASD